MPDALEGLRDRLDQIDDRLLELLADRHSLVDQVVEVKARHRREVRDPAREAEILERLSRRAAELGLAEPFVRELFCRVIAESVARQLERLGSLAAAPPRSVAFQGTAGAYSELAAERLLARLGWQADPRGYPDFETVVASLEAGAVELAVVPVENSRCGPIEPALAALRGHAFECLAEATVEIRHCLLGFASTSLADVARVRSHPQALAQCREFLAAHSEWQVEPAWDTAGAAREVAEAGDPGTAAIASREAAQRYGLVVLAEDVADQPGNSTRFWLLRRGE